MHTNSSNTKTVVIISSILIILTLFSILFLLLPGTGRENYIADIYQNGELIHSIPLGEITEAYTFVVEGDGGCRNEIRVSKNGIAILSADCPDKLCVNQGMITNSKLPITCLPNRLVIQLRAVDTDGSDLITDDIISY